MFVCSSADREDAAQREAAAPTVNSLCLFCLSIERRLYVLPRLFFMRVRVGLWSLTPSEEAHIDQYAVNWKKTFFLCAGINFPSFH